MQNKEHLRAMEKTWVHSVAGKQNFDGVSAFSFSWLESTCSTRESSASEAFLRALAQQGKRCTQILALNIYEGIRSLPTGIPLVVLFPMVPMAPFSTFSGKEPFSGIFGKLYHFPILYSNKNFDKCFIKGKINSGEIWF